MSTLSVTSTRITKGIWRGIVTSEKTEAPQVTVQHLGIAIADVRMVEDAQAGHWILEVPIPADAIAEGVQTFVISDTEDGEKLASFSLIAGEVLGDDLRAEMELLRAELDMLKRAFRRHCVETA